MLTVAEIGRLVQFGDEGCVHVSPLLEHSQGPFSSLTTHLELPMLYVDTYIDTYV